MQGSHTGHSGLVGKWLSGQQHGVSDDEQPSAKVGELSPRPSLSPGTSWSQMSEQNIPKTRGTGVAGNLVCTGVRRDPWLVDGGSFVRICPCEVTIPGVLVAMAEGMEEMAYLVDFLFLLAIALRVITRRKTDYVL